HVLPFPTRRSSDLRAPQRGGSPGAARPAPRAAPRRQAPPAPQPLTGVPLRQRPRTAERRGGGAVVSARGVVVAHGAAPPGVMPSAAASEGPVAAGRGLTPGGGWAACRCHPPGRRHRGRGGGSRG